MKPLNQEEKERLAAYRDQYKTVPNGTNLAYIQQWAKPADLSALRGLPAPVLNQLASVKAKLVDYIDLLEREHLKD